MDREAAVPAVFKRKVAVVILVTVFLGMPVLLVVIGIMIVKVIEKAPGVTMLLGMVVKMREQARHFDQFFSKRIVCDDLKQKEYDPYFFQPPKGTNKISKANQGNAP